MDFPEGPNVKAPGDSDFPLEPFQYPRLTKKRVPIKKEQLIAKSGYIDCWVGYMHAREE